MTACAVAFVAIAAVIGIWLFETRRPRMRTTEDTWWRVVAMHVQNATPKRRL